MLFSIFSLFLLTVQIILIKMINNFTTHVVSLPDRYNETIFSVKVFEVNFQA